jgi:hypothetical protein
MFKIPEHLKDIQPAGAHAKNTGYNELKHQGADGIREQANNIHGTSEYYSPAEKANAENCKRVRPVGAPKVRKKYADEVADANGYVIEGRLAPSGKTIEQAYWPGKSQEEEHERNAALTAQLRAEEHANR